jgi:catechol 2,3-dioxygenase-like lactoylglutathione lyase family enzyme
MTSLLLAAVLLSAGPPASGASRHPSTFFAVSVPNLEASVRWYADAFGLSATVLPGNEKAKVALLRGPDLLLELVEPAEALEGDRAGVEGRYRVQGFFKVGFFVKDLDAEVARLRGKGVRFKGSVFEDRVARARSILVLDRDGNIIQLFEALGPSAARPEHSTKGEGK